MTDIRTSQEDSQTAHRKNPQLLPNNGILSEAGSVISPARLNTLGITNSVER